MDAWKAAGNAGREFDDDLWNAFNEARQNSMRNVMNSMKITCRT